jgi:hypothetical protein
MQMNAGAQPAASDPGSIKSCSSVQGANCTSQPGPSTPVAAEYRESYAAYLEMKNKARGGTVYIRAGSRSRSCASSSSRRRKRG